MDKAGPSPRATKPKGVKLIKPVKRFDGIVLSKPKNFDRDSYSSLDGKNSKSRAMELKEKNPTKDKRVRFDDIDKVMEPLSPDEETSSEERDEVTEEKFMNKSKTAESVSRPFDSIAPLEVTPIPRNLPKGVVPAPPEEKMHRGSKKLASEDTGPAYKLRSENYKPGLIEEVADCIMSSQITVTAEEVCEISPQVRKIITRKNRNQRVPVQRVSQFIYEIPDPEDTSLRKDRFKDLPDATIPLAAQWIEITDLGNCGDFDILMNDNNGVKKGSCVQKDIVNMFKQDLAPEDPRRNITIVARTSNSLRVIYPKVNGSTEEVEGLLDPGSQIISMSKRVAVGCGLSWDPEVVINMMSANGELNPTCGLARNVPVLIGDITVYFQIHILNEAPYDMLIGRPFDALVESRVINDKTGGAVLTITDPNSGQKCTIGTYARGRGKHIEPPPIESLESMNRPRQTLHTVSENPVEEKEDTPEVNFHSSKI